MSEENAVVEAPVDTSQDEFNAGFDDTEPTPTPAQSEEPEVAKEEPQADPEPTPEPAPEPEFVQLTRQELDQLRTKAAEVDGLKADLHKGVSNAFGKLGTLEQQVQQLRNSGRKVEITDDMISEAGLSEYPELAGGIKKLFGRVFEAPITPVETTKQAAPAFDPSQIDQVLQQKIDPVKESVRRELATEALADRHPDYKEIAKSTEYAAWVKAQPAEKQAQIQKSVNPYFAARVLDEYKEHRRKQKDVATARQKKLEAAVTPRGSGGTAPAGRTDDDEFNAGFNG